MILKLNGLMKACCYRLRFGGAVRIAGYPVFERQARINLKKGTVSIGRGFTMKPNAYIAVMDGGKVTIGQSVSLARNSILVCHDSITIGSNCAIAPNVTIYDHDHKFGPEGICPGYNTAPVVIERNCWIGAGVTILRGTHIGEGCVIGAGCIVKGNIPPHSLVTGDRSLVIRPITVGRAAEGEKTDEV